MKKKINKHRYNLPPNELRPSPAKETLRIQDRLQQRLHMDTKWTAARNTVWSANAGDIYHWAFSQARNHLCWEGSGKSIGFLFQSPETWPKTCISLNHSDPKILYLRKKSLLFKGSALEEVNVTQRKIFKSTKEKSQGERLHLRDKGRERGRGMQKIFHRCLMGGKVT